MHKQENQKQVHKSKDITNIESVLTTSIAVSSLQGFSTNGQFITKDRNLPHAVRHIKITSLLEPKAAAPQSRRPPTIVRKSDPRADKRLPSRSISKKNSTPWSAINEILRPEANIRLSSRLDFYYTSQYLSNTPEGPRN